MYDGGDEGVPEMAAKVLFKAYCVMLVAWILLIIYSYFFLDPTTMF